jgi:hypothetical protein
MEVVMKGFSEHEGRGGGWGGPGGHRGRGPGGGRGFGRGFGRPGGWQQADLPAVDDVEAWFAGRLPGDWFTGAVSVETDREEITVVGEIAAPEYPANADDAAKRAADSGRIGLFREQTRDARMKISDEAESRYGRKVAWGVTIGETRQLFTHLSVPVMTRLRQPDRQVLDTLVDSGVARSRSEALAWCVRLVGEHTDDWLTGLRAAMSEVDKLRAEGPAL